GSEWVDVYYVDENGNVKFAGHLEGATGVFSGKLSTQQDIDVGKRVYIEYDPGQESGIYFGAPGGQIYSYIKRESSGQILFFNEESRFRFNTDVSFSASVTAQRVFIHSIPGFEYALTVDGGGIYSSSNITVGSTSGYINLRPGNNHGFIEFYRTAGRAAYVGVPSAGSEYFDINADGL